MYICLFSVIKPYDAKKYITRKTMTGCAVIFIILFTLLNGYIVLAEVYTKTLPSGRWICVYPDTVMVDVRQFLIGQIPILVLIPSNALIIGKIWHQRKKWKNLDNAQKNEEKKSFQLTIMILTLTISFIILALPFSIYLMAFYNTETRDKDAKLRNILSTFAFANAAINFYLYFLSSEMYRKAVKKQFVLLFQLFGFLRGGIEPMSQTSGNGDQSKGMPKSKNVTKSTAVSQN